MENLPAASASSFSDTGIRARPSLRPRTTKNWNRNQTNIASGKSQAASLAILAYIIKRRYTKQENFTYDLQLMFGSKTKQFKIGTRAEQAWIL